MFGYVTCHSASNSDLFQMLIVLVRNPRPENPHFPQGILRGGHLFTAPELCLSSFMALTLEANFSSISRRIWRPESGPLLAAKASSSWWFFTNPFWNICERQIGSFPQGSGLKSKNVWNHLLVLVRTPSPKQQEKKRHVPSKKKPSVNLIRSEKKSMMK